jgi:predicted HAD superfamily Cof-like phosphohydrolase
MKNNNPLPLHSMVTVWLTTIGQQQPTQPEMMSDEVRDFNMKLIDEEVTELLTAMKNNDFTETCDGYFDALWVITQAAMLNGININELLFAGFNSNMSKFCKTRQEATDSVIAYELGVHPAKMGERIDTKFEQVGELYIVRRISDNKVMKSINFKEPDFSAITSRLIVNEEV